jgi:hypothetical protein
MLMLPSLDARTQSVERRLAGRVVANREKARRDKRLAMVTTRMTRMTRMTRRRLERAP